MPRNRSPKSDNSKIRGHDTESTSTQDKLKLYRAISSEAFGDSTDAALLNFDRFMRYRNILYTALWLVFLNILATYLYLGYFFSENIAMDPLGPGFGYEACVIVLRSYRFVPGKCNIGKKRYYLTVVKCLLCYELIKLH